MAAAAAARPPVSLDQLLRRLLAGCGAPGAVGAVAIGGRIETAAAGIADLRTGRPMRADDRVRIGSLTKTYIAALALEHLELDRAYRDGERITVRDLLAHTSGLRDYMDEPEFVEPFEDDPFADFPPRRCVEIALARPPLFEPGERVSYSNTNYQLVGLLLEEATGERLALLLPDLDAAPTARGYALPGGWVPVDGDGPRDVTDSISGAWADGGVVAAADDVARFFAHLPGELVEQELGGFRVETRCGAAFQSDGGMPGYETRVLASPDGARVAVVAANAQGGGVGKALGEAAAAAYCG